MLLHLTTLDPWRRALAAEHFGADQVHSSGFLHLSTPAQVTIPANALFRDVGDLWLLVIDPSRLRAPLRWEPGGAPDDPPDMVFPHLYGPLEVAAVTAVVPYRRPGGDAYVEPRGLPGLPDLPARAVAMELYVAMARSATVAQSGDGVAVHHPDFEFSWDHNRLLLPTAVTAAEAAELCRRGFPHRGHWTVCINGSVRSRVTEDYVAAGWNHSEELLMIATAEPAPERVDAAAGIAVQQVSRRDLDALRIATMRRYAPDITADRIQQMPDRAETTASVCRLLHLAVLDGDAPVAQLDLRIVGATAAIDDVATDPPYEGRGYASALVLAAIRAARAAGCDAVFLRADEDDWPRKLYERLGFTVEGTTHVFNRDL